MNGDAMFHRIFAEVWRSLTVAMPWPTHRTPPPGHQSRALGVRYSKPVIRSWLPPDCPAVNPPHSLTAWTGNTVKKLALPAGIAGIAVCGAVIVGSILSNTLPPMATAPSPTTSITCQEDMPCWVCSPEDDRCAGSTDEHTRTAWETFDEAGGPRSLKVDPSRKFRVDYVGSSETYPQNVGGYDLALVGKDFRWYVFRAAYID